MIWISKNNSFEKQLKIKFLQVNLMLKIKLKIKKHLPANYILYLKFVFYHFIKILQDYSFTL